MKPAQDAHGGGFAGAVSVRKSHDFAPGGPFLKFRDPGWQSDQRTFSLPEFSTLSFCDTSMRQPKSAIALPILFYRALRVRVASSCILSMRMNYAIGNSTFAPLSAARSTLVDLSHRETVRFAATRYRTIPRFIPASSAGLSGYHRRNQDAATSKITERIAQIRLNSCSCIPNNFSTRASLGSAGRRGAFKFPLFHRHLLEVIDAVAHDIGRNGETQSLGR